MVDAKVVIDLETVKGYLVSLVILDEENHALRRKIMELEFGIDLRLGPQGLNCTKVGGFSYQCLDCNEFFDIPGLNHGCPFCNSYEIECLMALTDQKTNIQS